MFEEGDPLQGEDSHIIDDDFRGMSSSFTLTVGKALNPLFKSVPEGLAFKDGLKARASALLRSAVKGQD